MYATYKIGKDLFLWILLERRNFYIFLQYEFFSFCFFFFFFFCFLNFFMHTYIYEFSCCILFKANRLVNKHDTKDSNELKEDHDINYSVGFGLWAQFRDKFLMRRKLLNSDFSIAYSFWCFFFGHWLKRKPVSSNSMLVNRIIRLVSFLFFFWKFLYTYLSIVNGFRFCCFIFCMQKMAWIREFLLKFTNFKMKINLISIIYKIFVCGLFV